MEFFASFLKVLFGQTPQPVAQTVKPEVAIPSTQPTSIYPVPASAFADGILDVSEVYLIAKYLKGRHSELAMADPYMAAVMATTESGGNTRKIPTFLERYEPGFFRKYLMPKGITDKRRATSYGIMQVMLNTAMEDYARGFTSYGRPTDANLKNPYIAVYYGMAHQVYVRKRLASTGIPVTEKNIVMSYNGGIGQNNSDTQNHYAKYASNKSVVNNAIA